MSTPLVPNFAWQTLRITRKVGALHGIIEVPEFTAVCGPQRISRAFFGSYFTGTATAPAGMFGYNAATYEAWVKPLPGYINTQIYVIQATGPANALRINANLTVTFLLRRTIDGASTSVTTTEMISVGEWNHIAGTWDGTTMKVYINGVLSVVTSALAAGTLLGTAGVSQFLLLDYFNSVSSANMYANEIRIWNVARTQEQIQLSMYYSRDITGVIDVGLQGYWPLQEDTGNTIAQGHSVNCLSFGVKIKYVEYVSL